MTAVFDTLQYTKGAELIGMPRSHAEYQASAIAKLVDHQLVNKSHLALKLKNLEITLIKWTIGISLGQIGIILAIIRFFVKP